MNSHMSKRVTQTHPAFIAARAAKDKDKDDKKPLSKDRMLAKLRRWHDANRRLEQAAFAKTG
jgi:hypothetical protein